MSIPASATACAFPNEVCPRTYHYKPEECLGNSGGASAHAASIPSGLPDADDDDCDSQGFRDVEVTLRAANGEILQTDTEGEAVGNYAVIRHEAFDNYVLVDMSSGRYFEKGKDPEKLKSLASGMNRILPEGSGIPAHHKRVPKARVQALKNARSLATGPRGLGMDPALITDTSDWDTMATYAARESARFQISKAISCPVTGQILDVNRDIAFVNKDGMALRVISRDALTDNVEATEEFLHGMQAKGTNLTLYDLYREK